MRKENTLTVVGAFLPKAVKTMSPQLVERVILVLSLPETTLGSEYTPATLGVAVTALQTVLGALDATVAEALEAPSKPAESEKTASRAKDVLTSFMDYPYDSVSHFIGYGLRLNTITFHEPA